MRSARWTLSNLRSKILCLLTVFVALSMTSTGSAEELDFRSSEVLLKSIFKGSVLRERIRDYPLITQFNRRHFLREIPIELYFGPSADLCELSAPSLKTESLGSRLTINPWPIIRFVKTYYVILRVIDGRYVSRDGVEIPLRKPKIVAIKRFNQQNYYLLRIQKYEGNDDFRILDSIRCKRT